MELHRVTKGVWSISNFLPKSDNLTILEQSIKLHSSFKQAKIYSKESQSTVDLSVRDNESLSLDNYDQGKTILSIMQSALFDNPSLVRLLSDASSFFSILPYANFWNNVLSRWGDGHFYDWHRDSVSSMPLARVITAVYYFNSLPQKFHGGDICFKSDGKEVCFSPTNNTLVLFPSMMQHKVSKTLVKSSDPTHYRNSINTWIGFKLDESIRPLRERIEKT